MIAVLEDLSCPQCGFPVLRRTITESGETHEECNFCGYYKDKSLNGTVVKRGFGTAHTKYSIEKFTHRLSKEEIELYKSLDDVVELYVWNDFSHKLDNVVGCLPTSYENYLKNQMEEARYYARFRENGNHNLSNYEEF